MYPLRSHILQADSKEMYGVWIAALQKGIGAAFQRIHSIENSGNYEKGSADGGSRRSTPISNHNNNKVKKIR